MNKYTLPTFLLLGASGLMLMGILKSSSHASHAAAELAAERRAVETAQAQLMATEQATKAATTKSAPADRFLDVWKPELSADPDIERIFGQLDTLAVGNLLSPSGKNFTAKPNYFFNGHQLAVQNVNITVAGDYYRTLNWLGAVENAFPLARVEQISYANNGNSLTMAVQLVFPRKFDSE